MSKKPKPLGWTKRWTKNKYDNGWTDENGYFRSLRDSELPENWARKISLLDDDRYDFLLRQVANILSNRNGGSARQIMENDFLAVMAENELLRTDLEKTRRKLRKAKNGN